MKHADGKDSRISLCLDDCGKQDKKIIDKTEKSLTYWLYSTTGQGPIFKIALGYVHNFFKSKLDVTYVVC